MQIKGFRYGPIYSPLPFSRLAEGYWHLYQEEGKDKGEGSLLGGL